MQVREVVAELRSVADPSRLAGMARVGIAVDRALGVGMPELRSLARRCGTDQRLATGLWRTGLREARIVATLVADADRIDAETLDRWVADLDSWEICDALADLVAAGPHAEAAIRRWARSGHGYTVRCAFSTIARLAVRGRQAPDGAFTRWFPSIRRAAMDERNEVRKAVSWALRQIGKRNARLREAALEQADGLLELAERRGSRSARWIARDVTRDLTR